MRAWTLAFALGIGLGAFIPAIPGWPVLILCCLGGGLLGLWRAARLPAAFLLGVCWLLLFARNNLDLRWEAPQEASDVWVHGTVNSLVQPLPRGRRLQLRVDALCDDEALAGCTFGVPPQGRFTARLTLYQNQLQPQPGERWQLRVRLRPPRGSANPGAFDYEAWLLQQGIHALGYVRDEPGNRRLEAAGSRQWLTRLRAATATRLASLAPGLRHGGLIRALTLGERSGIPERDWDLFSASGTNHLMVISGLHIGLIALACCTLGARLARVWNWLLLTVTAPRVGACCGIAGAVVYAALAGFSLPVQRALVMTAVLFSGRLLSRQTASVQALCLALVPVLLLDPLAPQSAGFWLSFTAVAVLLSTVMTGRGEEMTVVETRVRRLLRACVNLCRTQLLVSLGMLPVMLLFFQQVSVVAPLVNLVAIPFIAQLVVPLSLLSLLLLWLWPAAALLVLILVDQLLAGYLGALEWLFGLGLPGLLPLPMPPWPGRVLCCLLVLVVLSRIRLRWRWLALMLVPLTLLWPQSRLPHGVLELEVLDVGQGLAAVIRTRNHSLLYDAGPWFSPNFDAGSDTVVPYLRYRNIRRLDTVVISHADLDHAGGLAGVATAYPQARYLGSDLEIFTALPRAALCRRGQRWQWDGIEFRFLHPGSDGVKGRNDASCVLEIWVGAQHVLLPGDIERAAERQLLRLGLQGPVALLLAPHHGSGTSSTPVFVARLQPRVVVYASGYRNRFGHPAGQVRARYQASGTREYLSADSGALRFRISAQGIDMVREQRRARHRFWAWPPAP